MANLYASGFADGYRAGIKKGQDKPSEKVVASDLMYIYGMMCIHLFDLGFSEDEIRDFCEKIQQLWVKEYDETMTLKALGEYVEPLPQKVSRITGVDLLQTFGLENYEND